MTTQEEDEYIQGDKVRLMVDIWDSGDDGHHPPCYLAHKGEVLTVRRGTDNATRTTIGVSHGHRTDNYFNVTLNEIERAT